MRRRLVALALAAGVLGACYSAGDPDPTVPAKIVRLSGDAQTSLAGSLLEQPLVVRVLNAADEPVKAAKVEWVAVSAGGQLSDSTSTTDDLGAASVSYQLGPGTGVQSVKAYVRSAVNSPVTFTFTALPNTGGGGGGGGGGGVP